LSFAKSLRWHHKDFFPLDVEAPALLLLWTSEKTGWRIVAWGVEVP
jgi:hypothetical protein